jgi:hypothetical protein
MTRDRDCPINPLATHTIYIEGNMETIAKTIPIDVSKNREALFLFNQIISRFNIPREIVTDHGCHFQNKMMSELMSKLQVEERTFITLLPTREWLGGSCE